MATYKDGELIIEEEQMPNGDIVELTKSDDCVISKKITKPDGSYTEYNRFDQITEEQTADGVLTKYGIFDGVSKKKAEIYPDGKKITFYENGNIFHRLMPDGSSYSYYENGNLANCCLKDYEISFDENGVLQYKFENGQIELNPDYFSYYRLGLKSAENDEHWVEKGSLDPTKKTLVCLGGDQTRDARSANGNINVFAPTLGLSQEQLDAMQLCSCYRQYKIGICRLLSKTGCADKQMEDDYKREILHKFMPYMAKVENGKFQKYSAEELSANFRNIIFEAHCYGANDLIKVSAVFRETMTKLGYTKQEQANAMRQAICITNNSQHEFTEELGFTTFHRYSVKDGQFEPEYDHGFSAAYPVFLQKHSEFSAKNGDKASFAQVLPNEMLLIFDKVLNTGSEHNEAFWTINAEKLTPVGKQQAQLMQQLGQFWYANDKELPKPADLLRQVSQSTQIEQFTANALESGKKLSKEVINPLKNPTILSSALKRYKDSTAPLDKSGVYKLLSEKYRD